GGPTMTITSAGAASRDSCTAARRPIPARRSWTTSAVRRCGTRAGASASSAPRAPGPTTTSSCPRTSVATTTPGRRTAAAGAGSQFRYSDQAGVETNVVPPIKQIIPTPASKVDRDGNERGGIKSVLLQAPLGTYTPWNPVASGPLKGNEGNLAAGYIAFAQTR